MAAITLQLSVSFGYAYDVNEQRTIQIYERISPCIVSIDAQLPTGISSGTGCIISTNGGILTSSHVISNSNDIDVTLNSGKTYKAKIVSKIDNDLALLKSFLKKG